MKANIGDLVAYANERYFADDPYQKFTKLGEYKGFIVFLGEWTDDKIRFIGSYPECLDFLLVSEEKSVVKLATRAEHEEIYETFKNQIGLSEEE